MTHPYLKVGDQVKVEATDGTFTIITINPHEALIKDTETGEEVTINPISLKFINDL